MNEKAIRRAARATRAHAGKMANARARDPQYAIVRSKNPLTAELTVSRLLLEEDDIVVSQAVRQYDLRHGLVVGDTLVVQPERGGDFIATAVVSDKGTFDGAGNTSTGSGNPVWTGVDSLGGAVAITVDRNIVKKIPYYEGGVLIGYLPVYENLP